MIASTALVVTAITIAAALGFAVGVAVATTVFLGLVYFGNDL